MATKNGTSGNDNLIGTPDNDVLNGFGGNDTLNGGTGIDTLVGGTGNDIYIVDTTTDIIREYEGGGSHDLVRASVSYTLGDYLNNLTLTGTSAINGTGNSLNNIIRGNDANNILDGRGGIDTLIGGKGNDTYTVDSTTDTIIEYEGGGSGDIVKSSVSYTLGAWLNNLTLTGTKAINGTGNSLDNTITGNNADNILNGGAGNDTIDGGGGEFEDTLDGGAGNDHLTGSGVFLGSGGDTFMYGGYGNDTLAGFAASMYGSYGNDKLFGEFTTQHGDDGNDTLSGDDSNLYGDDGDDVLSGEYNVNLNGGKGNDTLTTNGVHFNSFEFNAPNEGVDTIVSSGFSDIDSDIDFGDQIYVSASGFGGGLTARAVITPDQFRIGTAAADASDRFIYNNATGALFFDPTGSNKGATDQVQFATLVGTPEITNNDIFVTA